jgi:hypothetical protein
MFIMPKTGNSDMEKRSHQRHMAKVSIVCSRLSSSQNEEPIVGVILNFCKDGFYVEFKEHVKVGTIVVVRVTGCFSESSMDGGVRSQTLVQVRWSKPFSIEDEICYATGLKYVTVD